MQSVSCVCCSLSSLESIEHVFVKSSANRRSFMDTADAVTVLRSKHSWPYLAADFTGHCTVSDNTQPKSLGMSLTNTQKEVRRSVLVMRTDVDASIASIQDALGKISSHEDASIRENNIIVEKNYSSTDSTLQDTRLEIRTVAVNNVPLQSALISTDSSGDHPFESSCASDSAREVKEMNYWKVSYSATETSFQCSSFSHSSRLILFKDAQISNCCDSLKPQSSYSSRSIRFKDAKISDCYDSLTPQSSYFSRPILFKDAKISNCCDSLKPQSSSYSSRPILFKDAKISDCHDSLKPRLSSTCNIDADLDCEMTNPRCKKFDKHRRRNRPQRSKCKWKKVPKEMQLNLRTSLFPRTGIIINNSCIDDFEENEIQQELELFQNALQFCEQKADVDDKVNETCTAAVSKVQEELLVVCEDNGTVETQQICEQLDKNDNHCVDLKSSNPVKNIQKSISGRNANKTLPELNSGLRKFKHKLDLDVYWLAVYENVEDITFYENKIPLRKCLDHEGFSGITNKKLRSKKKWKETKARIQIKTKYCRSISNSVHGQTFYVHHRVMKLMPMILEPRTYVYPLSLRRIDAAKGLAIGIKVVRASSAAPAGHVKQSPASRSAAIASRFAIDAYNADGDLAADVVNIMINLQHRDLLPEDYDLLLRLDDRVKPKTVDSAILTGLKTESVVCKCDVLDVCMVCLDPYEVGQTKKYLPCQHYFHETCIDNWLSNSSMNCPLDATPVS